MSEIPLTNHYHTLGIPPHADLHEIKRAYRRLVMELHPDKNEAAGAERMFGLVQEAYAVLSNPAQRKRYDRELNKGSMNSRPVAHTAEEVRKMSTTVLHKLQATDPGRVNRDQVYIQLQAILSVYHIQLLNRLGNATVNKGIVRDILACADLLERKEQLAILAMLEDLQEKDVRDIQQAQQRYAQHYYWQLLKIPLALLVAILCCWLIYRSQ